MLCKSAQGQLSEIFHIHRQPFHRVLGRLEKRKDEIGAYHKQLLYLKAYSPTEKLKLKRIPEVSKAPGLQHTIIARLF